MATTTSTTSTTVSNGDAVFQSLPEWTRLQQELLSSASTSSSSSTSNSNSRSVNRLQVLDDSATTSLCHIVFLDSFGGGNVTFDKAQSDVEQVAAVALALEALNQKVLPPRITLDATSSFASSSSLSTCPIQFSLQVLDMSSSSSDDDNSPMETLVELTKSGKVCAFIGAGASSLSLPTSIWTGFQGYVQISPTSTSQALDNKEWHPLFARAVASDLRNVRHYLDFFTTQLGISHLTLVYNEDSAYARGLVQDVADVLLSNEQQNTNANINISTLQVARVAMQPGQEASIEAGIRRIQQIGYTYVWCLFDDAETLDKLLLATYRSKQQNYQWFFGDSFHRMLGPRVFTAGGEDTALLLEAYQGVGVLESTASSLPELSRQFQGLDNPSDLDYLQSILPPSLMASRSSSTTSTRTSLQEDLSRLFQTGSTHMGFSVLAYQSAMALGLSACQAVRSIEQEEAEGGNTTATAFLTGPEHYQALLQTTFTDGDSIFALNARTGSRTDDTSHLQVRNYLLAASNNGDSIFQDTTTHLYNASIGAWTLLQNFTFSTGSASGGTTTVVPEDLPPLEIQEQVIGVGLRWTVLSLLGVLYILTAMALGWTIRNRKTRVVLASQPLFLYTICVGIFLFGSTMIPLVLDHGWLKMDAWNIACQRACTAKVWCFGLGACTILSAFAAKTHRVNRILNHPNKFQRIRVTVQQAAIPMVICLFVCISILTVMTIVAPPTYEWQVEGYDEYGRIDAIEGRCNYEDSMPYVVSLAILIFGLLIRSGYEAYRARNLATEFSESRYIFRALLSAVAVACVGFPILFLAEDNPNALAFSVGAIIWVSAISVLLWTFIPKYQMVRALNTAKSKKGGGSSGGTWTVTGLDSAAITAAAAAKLNGTTPVPVEPSSLTHAGAPNCSSNTSTSATRHPIATRIDTYPTPSQDSSAFKGMKILSHKTKTELLEENDQLQARVAELESLIAQAETVDDLQLSISALDVANGQRRSSVSFQTNPP